MLLAGGTGGHVYPGLALADELARRGHQLLWVGRRQGLEAELARRHGFQYRGITAAGFSGKDLFHKLRWPALLALGLVQSSVVLRDFGPDAVVAAGGYVSASGLLAATLTCRPIFLLELNRVPGRVTKLFLGRAKESYFAFPPDEARETERSVVTGSPLRPEFTNPVRKDNGRTVLILGGSGGARALTLAGLDAAAALGNLSFIILTGKRDFALARSRLRSGNCELVEYTERPSELYERATLAVSRAGGMVLSELVAYGIPAILVPYPHATDRHQDANASYLASVGAAIKLDQNRLSGLVSLIQGLMCDQGKLANMGTAGRALARPAAAQEIAERMERCLAG